MQLGDEYALTSYIGNKPIPLKELLVSRYLGWAYTQYRVTNISEGLEVVRGHSYERITSTQKRSLRDEIGKDLSRLETRAFEYL